MKFQFDDDGGRFLYFVISVYAIILIPITFIIFPRRKSKRMPYALLVNNILVSLKIFDIFLAERSHLPECCCDGCRVKDAAIASAAPNYRLRNFLTYELANWYWKLCIIINYHFLSFKSFWTLVCLRFWLHGLYLFGLFGARLRLLLSGPSLTHTLR